MQARNEWGRLAKLDMMPKERVMPEVPEHWQEWPEWIPRNWCKEVFDVDTIAGVAYVISQLSERGITIEQKNYNTPEQPRWFLKRDDVFEAYIYRETHLTD